VAIGQIIKDVISNITKVARNFGISKTTKLSFVEVQEQENPSDFEYTVRNDVKKIFAVTQGLELLEYFKQAAKLRYGLTEKEALTLAFQYGKKML
jgi:ABC-type uncharacterized transport system involved in gliding motility auxiliary subunit